MLDSKSPSRKVVMVVLTVICLLHASCQREYMDSITDEPTPTIQFHDLTASCDSACMYDTIVIQAHATGTNLKYEWQRAKGSLVPMKDDPSKAYFWGCYTCVGRLTVNCTVYNEFGSFTKEVEVFVWPWTKDKGRFPGWEEYIDRHGKW